MIERHITFSVLPDKGEAFERFFVDKYAPAMAQAPGFVRVELLREMDEPLHYQMVLRWADRDAATGWRTSPVHEALQPALAALHSGASIVAYEVVA
jgi:heme-degrading monooxygenase HmoA